MGRVLSKQELPEEALYEMLPESSQGVSELMAYLVEEHTKALAAYSDYYDELKTLRRAISARPATRIKTFPWPGASNIVIPLIRIAGDAVKARIVNTLLAPKPFWTCNHTSDTFAPFAKPAQNLLDWAARFDMQLPEAIDGIADQVVYLGKCPVKVSWKNVVKKERRYSRKTRNVEYVTRVVCDSPKIEPILLEDWLEPWGPEPSTQKPWNSHRVFLRLGDLTERLKNKLVYSSIDKIKDALLTQLPMDKADASEEKKLAWAMTEIIPLWETHVCFDVDSDGYREELIVLWSLEHQVPLSVKYNFFFHANRPTEMFFYLRHGDSQSSGDGIAQLLYPLQEGLSTFINQRTDNITIANMKFFKARKNAVKKGESIWPGKVVFMENPGEDMVTESLGTVSPESFQHESILRDYAERLSGIADPQLGREFDNPRVAATTTLSILQEGNRRFDMIVRFLREGFGRIGLRILQLYQQFEPRVPLEEILSEEDVPYARMLMDMSADEIEKSVIVQVNTSTAAINKETERQGMLSLFNLIRQFYADILNVTQSLIMNPQIPEEICEMVYDMARSSYNTIKEIVQSYDIADVGTFIVDVEEAMRAVRGGSSDIGTVEGGFNSGLTSFSRLVSARTGIPEAALGQVMDAASGANGGQPNGGANPGRSAPRAAEVASSAGGNGGAQI